MCRTIPSFRIAAILEEKAWKSYRKYLKNKNERKLFTEMFSITHLYNSACSNAVNPIRIHPIMMSIILHYYKMLKERILVLLGLIILLRIIMLRMIILLMIIISIQQY